MSQFALARERRTSYHSHLRAPNVRFRSVHLPRHGGAWSWLTVVSVALAAVTIGCATTSGRSQVDKKVDLVNKEKEPSKLLRRGKALVRLGDTTRAVQYLTAALDEGEDPNLVLPVLLPLLVKAGRYRVAIVHAKSYVSSHHEDVRTRFLLATLYRAVGKYPQARDELEEVIKLAPKHAEAHFALGQILRDQVHDLIEADHEFRIYLELRPRGRRADEARSSLLGSVP